MHVYVNVDEIEILENLSDQDLIEALVERGFAVSAPKDKLEKLKRLKVQLSPLSEPSDDAEDGLREIRDLLLERRGMDALVVLDRLLTPRFHSIGACEQAYAAALGRATTSDVGHRT